MAAPEMTGWHKSTRSSHTNGGCVEVGGRPGLIGIRDTKNRAGGTLIVSPQLFTAFVQAIKDNRLH